jgi:hypothetical protein
MRRLAWQFLGTLLVVGFVLAYWWVIVLAVSVVVGGCLSWLAYQQHQASVAAEERRQAWPPAPR